MRSSRGAGAEILFPFGQYFSTCDLYYRTSSQEEWTVVPMTDEGGDLFAPSSRNRPARWSLHFGISDLGATSAITPYSAAMLPTRICRSISLSVWSRSTDDQDDANLLWSWACRRTTPQQESGNHHPRWVLQHAGRPILDLRQMKTTRPATDCTPSSRG